MDSMLPKRSPWAFFRRRWILAISAFLVCVFPAFSAHAYNILFYYNSLDGTEGALLKCVTILGEAGHQVTAVDVKGRNYDPTGDKWPSP